MAIARESFSICKDPVLKTLNTVCISFVIIIADNYNF